MITCLKIYQEKLPSLALGTRYESLKEILVITNEEITMKLVTVISVKDDSTINY